MKRYILQAALLTIVFWPMVNVNFLSAQTDFNGEMYVDIINPDKAKALITVDAVSVVWGSKNENYPVTHDFDYYETFDSFFRAEHVDNLMSTHEIAAISPQNVGGGNYVWCAWSDDGDQDHDVSVDGTSYSLDFTAKFVGTYITGPGYLSKGQTGTYDCNPACASGNCSYQWYKRYDGSEYWYTLGTNQTQQITMHSTPFTVKVDVTDDDYDKTATDTKYVTNELDGGESGSGGGIENVVVLYNYPNPCNPETRILYRIPAASFVRLKIFNLMGHEVKTLQEVEKQAGEHSVVWDARDDLGRDVSSGIYIYKLTVEPVSGNGKRFEESRKLMLVR